MLNEREQHHEIIDVVIDSAPLTSDPGSNLVLRKADGTLYRVEPFVYPHQEVRRGQEIIRAVRRFIPNRDQQILLEYRKD